MRVENRLIKMDKVIQQLDKIHWSPLSIIYSATQFLAHKEEVKILDIGSGSGKFCLAAALKGLHQHKVNGHLIARFVEKTCQNLNEFTPMLLDAQQWSNIRIARIQFNQLKHTAQENEHQTHKDPAQGERG